MSLSSAELWQRITAQQLASPMQCRSWAAEAAAGLTASEAIDGNRMAGQLVALGRLSQFQADILTSGSDEPLVRRGWRIIEPVNFAPLESADVRALWADWWVATKSATAAPVWVRWLTAADLAQETLREANPSLPLALQHSQVTSMHLQSVTAPEMVEGALQLGVAPLNGKLLSGLIVQQPMQVQTVLAMLLQIADALAALHAVGLAHGRITPDRLCSDQEGNWHVLRDPLCSATLGIGRSNLGLIASRLPANLTSAHFMAPEFLLPAQAATPQTDCYALGCVAWLALAGRPPVTGKHPEQILAAHADQQLDVGRLAHVPEPLTRCLLHCLAKNPAARFRSGRELRESLVEAQRLIQTGPMTAARKPTEPDKPVAAPQPAVAPKSAAAPEPAAAVGATAPERPTSVPRAELPPSTPAVVAKPVASTVSHQRAPADQAATAGERAQQQRSIPAAPTPAAPAAAVSAPATSLAQAPSSEQPPAAVQPAVTSQPAGVTQPAAATLAAAATEASMVGVQRPGKGKPAVRSGVRRGASKRKKSNGWLVPAMGGGALVALLLLILVLNGGFGSSRSRNPDRPSVAASNGGSAARTASGTGAVTSGRPDALGPDAAATDPRLEDFELVDSSLPVLWAPPRRVERLPLDLLPPGGQLFLSLRPAAMFAQPKSKELLGLLDTDLGPLWKWLSDQAGVPIEAIEQVTVAAYAGQSGVPQFASRVRLGAARPLEQLRTSWGNPTEAKSGEHVVLISADRGYYVGAQPLVNSQSVVEFMVGPVELAHEAAQMQGAAGPMTSQLEQLWQWTDRNADVSLLLAPSFLFTEGRQIVQRAPERLRDQLVQWLSRDMRGGMLNSSLSDQWYYELRLAGASDRDAGAIQQKLSDAIEKLPQEVESWFVSQSPHPYWRAVALRYPNMLRALAQQTRFGVEDGQAVANAYLPAEAAPNLLYGSWIALQPSATMSIGSQASTAAASPAPPPLTAEQVLDRSITVVVDVQPIEVVLQLIGEAANENLPAGTKPLRFELDGAAFQRAGFTRNQPVRDFKIEAQPVRLALTELAKVGNPVPGVSDLHSDEQKLIWVLTEAADQPGEPLISLTSREAATAAGQTLPAEFAPAAP